MKRSQRLRQLATGVRSRAGLQSSASSESNLSYSNGGSSRENDGELPSQLQNFTNVDNLFLCTDFYSSSDDIAVANVTVKTGQIDRIM